LAVPEFSAGDLLTVAEALRILPVGRSTIYRMIEAGRLSALRVPSTGSRRGRVLVLRSSLDELIASGLRRQVAASSAGETTSDTIAARVIRGGRRKAE